jgi:uncharacterized protein YbaP (TraB family)
MKTTKLIKSLTATAILLSGMFSHFANADAAVWKVSKGDNEVFIAGTVHILPPSQFPLPSEFDQAYQQADSIVLEAKLPDPTDQKAQMAMIQQLSYPAGEKLSKVISESTYQKLAQHFTQLGINLDELNGFKPGFILSIMTAMAAQKAQLAGEGVDAYFEKQAKKDNKKTAYLETAEFQLNMLANMGKGNEDKFIQDTIEEMSEFKTLFENILIAWRAGDMNAIDELIIQEAQSQDPKSYQTLFVERNHNWIPQIEAMFNNKEKELVLVGAGHLAGKDSVLALLSAKGYTVSKL